MNYSNKHRGKIFNKVLDQQKVKRGDLAKKLGVHRNMIQTYYQQPKLNLDFIYEVGKIIGHNFSEDFPEMIGFYQQEFFSTVNESGNESAESLLFKAITERDRYKKQYEELKKSYIITLRKLKAFDIEQIENDIENKR